MANSEHKITVIFNKDLYKQIESDAEKAGLSKSAYIRMILTKHLKCEKKVK